VAVGDARPWHPLGATTATANVSPVNLRRVLALGAAGLAVIAALTACGFNYPTDRINNVPAGVDYRDGTVDILNAVVVAKQPDSGTFVATFVNGSPDKTISLQSASGDNTAIASTDAKPFSLVPGALRNLAATKGIPVSGTFALGQFVNISFQFDNGEAVTMNVPVVLDDGQWAGLDIATPSASGSPESPSESPSVGTSSTATQSPSASSS
jgi:hypothetical protein